ncbi:MAG: hypothetical protein ACYCZF_13850 [Anaerolineae bacterium]
MHEHFSGLEGVKVALYVIVILGTTNMLAMKHKDNNRMAAAWANLFGVA